ncbi:MAG: NDP-sugar synthase, partial [Deltaproteobacteria bacterium]|nr:NDP-sugar synthase [Deltaproteobacteria bacterium]
DVRVERRILGTGGGIKNTEDFWDDDPFVVINADILTDIDLERALADHQDSDAMATLVLHDCEPFNQIKIDGSRNITDIAKKHHPERLAFTGIHIINPDLLSWIPGHSFSDIIACYQTLIGHGKTVKAYIADHHYWCDIGSMEGYFRANRNFLDNRVSIAPSCDIAPSARLPEWAVLGERTRLEKDVEVKRSILWEGVTVKKHVRVIDSVITSDRTVERDVIGDIY